MDRLQALHTMARRHCLARFAFWAQTYRRFQAGEEIATASDLPSKSQQADAIFPRYLVWEAILGEVERLDPHSTRTIDELRTHLIEAAWRSQTAFTSNPKLSTTARSSMNDERLNFEAEVSSFLESDLVHVDPLEPRRVFTGDELRKIWYRLNSTWKVTDDYWWPLRRGDAPATVIAFHTDWFDEEKNACLRSLLTSHGVELTWEVREFREWGCERPVSLLAPRYTGEEGYWTSQGMEWLVYASHESSITLAGEWLKKGFCRAFQGCERQTYQGPMSTADKRGTWAF